MKYNPTFIIGIILFLSSMLTISMNKEISRLDTLIRISQEQYDEYYPSIYQSLDNPELPRDANDRELTVRMLCTLTRTKKMLSGPDLNYCNKISNEAGFKFAKFVLIPASLFDSIGDVTLDYYVSFLDLLGFTGAISFVQTGEFPNQKLSKSVEPNLSVTVDKKKSSADKMIEAILPKIPKSIAHSCKIDDLFVGCQLAFKTSDVESLEFVRSMSKKGYQPVCVYDPVVINCYVNNALMFHEAKYIISKARNIDLSLSNTQFLEELRKPNR